jgi:hypothetical protein
MQELGRVFVVSGRGQGGRLPTHAPELMQVDCLGIGIKDISAGAAVQLDAVA